MTYSSDNNTTHSVSVVIPAYNENETIVKVIEDFKKSSIVDTILVIDNNSTDDTPSLASGAGVQVIFETSQGYGCALKRGLDEAKTDIVILTEADGSFLAKDINKLLAYIEDCDMVLGTRTTRLLIRPGANMKPLARLINILYGKIIELLWWKRKVRLTDVGCSYRAIWKDAYLAIRDQLQVTGPEFAPELTVAMLKANKKVIEVPVSYDQRYGGQSKHSGYFLALANTATRMMKTIIRHKIS